MRECPQMATLPRKQVPTDSSTGLRVCRLGGSTAAGTVGKHGQMECLRTDPGAGRSSCCEI